MFRTNKQPLLSPEEEQLVRSNKPILEYGDWNIFIPEYLQTTLILFYQWFVLGMVYFGMFLLLPVTLN